MPQLIIKLFINILTKKLLKFFILKKILLSIFNLLTFISTLRFVILWDTVYYEHFLIKT